MEDSPCSIRAVVYRPKPTIVRRKSCWCGNSTKTLKWVRHILYVGLDVTVNSLKPGMAFRFGRGKLECETAGDLGSAETLAESATGRRRCLRPAQVRTANESSA